MLLARTNESHTTSRKALYGREGRLELYECYWPLDPRTWTCVIFFSLGLNKKYMMEVIDVFLMIWSLELNGFSNKYQNKCSINVLSNKRRRSLGHNYFELWANKILWNFLSSGFNSKKIGWLLWKLLKFDVGLIRL